VATPGARPRSVLICHRGADFDREGLARWLASFSTVAGIVELDEPASRTVQRVRRELKRSGVLGFADVMAFRAFYRLAVAGCDRAWEASAVDELRRRFADVPEGTNVLRAKSVNSPECAEFIRACRPDFMLARCKTILKPAVFTLARGGTYVLHPGVCPEYRNAHGCFWALSAGDLSRVGLTLLRIDAGVDTGPVYGHFTYPFNEREESHIVIQLRVLLENLDAVRDTMLKAVSGAVEPLDVRGRRSAVWGQPKLTAYLRWKLRARKQPYADTHSFVP
jgi:folate-dependent phosphoribosylglycinamide formyltransferase PurN